MHKPDNAERDTLRRAMSIAQSDICVTFGCLHAGEGHVISQAASELSQQGFPIKCIVVPRHLKETPTLLKELGENTIAIQETFCAVPWGKCIVDKIGILDSMYKIADAAFIGGTFDTTGAHNMWDAARFCIPVFFGPDIHTQEESGNTLKEAGIGFQVSNSHDLALKLKQVLKHESAGFAKSLDLFISQSASNNLSIETYLP
jgi:3-deoxy-D-manno-octulosonic-acid transferase